MLDGPDDLVIHTHLGFKVQRRATDGPDMNGKIQHVAIDGGFEKPQVHYDRG
ncbi:hypothetical protein D3C86_2260140 [compost metagenome]